LVVAAALASPSAAAADGGAAPAAFNVEAAATPILVAASAPSALPLDVEAAVARSGVTLNSQPTGTATASPGYVPLYGALPLLGGVGALPAIGARLAPGLVTGLPTVIGLAPLPVSPGLIPSVDVPVLPSPDLPPIECVGYAPGTDPAATCGGPSQDLFGFSLGAASGTALGAGDPSDPSTLRVDAAVRGAGFGPASPSSLLPVGAGGVASAASSRIVNGRVSVGVSTAVSDLTIGTAVKIPSLETSLAVALDGTKANASVKAEQCTIGGATVAGVPVAIDGTGVHVLTTDASSAAAVAALNSTVQSTLTTLGVTLKALAGSADPGTADGQSFPGKLTLSDDGTKVSATLSCLQVGYRIPTSGTVMTLTFGTANVEAQAFTADAPGPAQDAPPATTGAPADPSLPGTVASGDGGRSATPAAPAGSATSVEAAAPPAAPTPGQGAPPPSEVVFQKAATASWRIPYPPFAVLALACPLFVVGRRGSNPLRPLRGARPST
jgi:hypothetical protein